MAINFAELIYNKIKLGDTEAQIYAKFNAVLEPTASNMTLAVHYLNQHEDSINALGSRVTPLETSVSSLLTRASTLETKTSVLEPKVSALESSVGSTDDKGTLFTRVASMESEKQNVSDRDESISNATPEKNHYPTTEAVKKYVDNLVSDTTFFAQINVTGFEATEFDGALNIGDTVPSIGIYAKLVNSTTVYKYVNGALAAQANDIKDGRMVYVKDAANGGLKAYYLLGGTWQLLGPDLTNYISKTDVDSSTLEYSGALRIKNSGVTTAKLEDASVTTAKLANTNVTTAKLANNAVTADKILASAVITAKLADKSVTAEKIADKAITPTQLADAINTALSYTASATNNTKGTVRGTAHTTSNWGAVSVGTDSNGLPAMTANLPGWVKSSTPPDSFGLLGGMSNQVLHKNSAKDRDVSWSDIRTLIGVTDTDTNRAIVTSTNLVTERAVFYGLPYINGRHDYNHNTNIYAPTTGGTDGYYLRAGGGTNTPTWQQFPYIPPEVTVTDRDGATSSLSSTNQNPLSERAIYYSTPGYNGDLKYTNNVKIYVPTSAGTSGQVLKSTGNIPNWGHPLGVSITKGSLAQTSGNYSYTFNGAAGYAYTYFLVIASVKRVGKTAVSLSTYIKTTFGNTELSYLNFVQFNDCLAEIYLSSYANGNVSLSARAINANGQVLTDSTVLTIELFGVA